MKRTMTFWSEFTHNHQGYQFVLRKNCLFFWLNFSDSLQVGIIVSEAHRQGTIILKIIQVLLAKSMVTFRLKAPNLDAERGERRET